MAVVLFHLNSVKLEPPLVPHGYLAVDFFFVLSGFVVAYAYEAALQTSLTLYAFLVKRLIRLYPLALLGAMMGFVILLLKWRFFPDKVDPLPLVLLSGLFNGLLLPTFFGGVTSRHEIFPTNGPLWTLFFEAVANLLWAWIGVRLRSATLLAIALVSWGALAVFACDRHTLNIGFEISSISAGLARVCFGFPVGVVIYRMRAWLRVPAWRGGPVILALALLAVLASPVNAAETGIPWWDLLSVLVFLPLIVVLGTGQGPAGRFGVLLGALSYPVYVLHFPMLLVASGLYQTALRGWNPQVLVGCSLAAICVFALAALRFYDEPLRRRLSQLTRKRAQRQAALS